MKSFSSNLILLLLLLFFCKSVSAQNNFWTDEAEAKLSISKEQRKIVPRQYRTLLLDTERWTSFLKKIPKEFSDEARKKPLVITLPMPDGSDKKFSIEETSVMEPELAAQFPGIRTYGGHGIDDPYATIKIDWNALGFHAMIVSPVTGSIFIDPYAQNTLTHYISYYKKDFIRKNRLIEDSKILSSETVNARSRAHRQTVPQCVGGTLRRYRLAVACTGEYARRVRGNSVTQAQALSAIVTTVNRVDGVYETEADIRLVLVANNNKIVFTNPATDPFSGNNNPSILIEESQRVIDSAIGSANYDIGHTFSTGGGGLAEVGVVCDDSQKAMGITGSANPVGDPYDIDFVAHEIGHQFGAEHTFNASTGECAGNGDVTTNTEPGSGVTIMAYAGICGAENDLEPNSIPYFHPISLDQIVDFVTNGTGNSCAVSTATGNISPVVNAGNDYVIPKSTPFVLTGSATDANGDLLTYSWEQVNVGSAFGDWNNPSGNAPIFRSFAPVTTPQRYFPKIANIINNDTTIGEILPSYARSLDFRLTARDNRAGGGGVCSDEMTVTVDGNSGPFIVTSPNTAATWQVGSFRNITWSVANTDAAPVNCSNVSIELSTDGGLTFPITLIASTPNDGAEEIIVPNNVTSTARIRVKAVNNVFFDISNVNVAIQPTQQIGFVFNNPPAVIACDNNAGTVISTSSLNGFSTPITLSASGNPTGSNVVFSANPINPGAKASITLTGTIQPGTYNITITGTAGTVVQTRVIEFIIGGPTQPPITLNPANNSIGNLPLPTFSWSKVRGAQNYNLQISTTPDFSSNVQNINNIDDTLYAVETPLALNTQYYWRVSAANGCSNQGPVSAAIVFKTADIECGEPLNSTDVPVTIDTVIATTISSVINVPVSGMISDVDVVGLRGKHSYIEDLTVSLRSPANTSVVLFDEVCPLEEDFSISFDDQAENSDIPCPPTDSLSYKPLQPLSAFNNESANGTWTLIVTDNDDLDGGSLDNWGLRICTYQATPLPVTWLSFTGQKNENNTVTLQWSIANEANHDHYNIERSADGVNFEPIGKIAAGNSAGALQQYLYNDVRPISGTNFYRLKQFDKDGSYSYSSIVKIIINEAAAQFVVFPNPTADNSIIRILNDVKQLDISLSDVSGKMVYRKNAGTAKAGEKIHIPVKGLGKGLYILTLATEKGIVTEKIMVQ